MGRRVKLLFSLPEHRWHLPHSPHPALHPGAHRVLCLRSRKDARQRGSEHILNVPGNMVPHAGSSRNKKAGFGLWHWVQRLADFAPLKDHPEN